MLKHISANHHTIGCLKKKMGRVGGGGCNSDNSNPFLKSSELFNKKLMHFAALFPSFGFTKIRWFSERKKKNPVTLHGHSFLRKSLQHDFLLSCLRSRLHDERPDLRVAGERTRAGGWRPHASSVHPEGRVWSEILHQALQYRFECSHLTIKSLHLLSNHCTICYNSGAGTTAQGWFSPQMIRSCMLMQTLYWYKTGPDWVGDSWECGGLVVKAWERFGLQMGRRRVQIPGLVLSGPRLRPLTLICSVLCCHFGWANLRVNVLDPSMAFPLIYSWLLEINLSKSAFFF